MMKATIRILALLLICGSMFFSCDKNKKAVENDVENDVVEKAVFKNDEFKSIVATALNKPADELTTDDLAVITGLDIYFYAERIENTSRYKEVCSVTLKKEGFDEVFEVYYNTPADEREGLKTPSDYSYNYQSETFEGYEDIKLLTNLKTISLSSEYQLIQEDPVKYFSDISGLEDVSIYNYVVEDLNEISRLTELTNLNIGINLRSIPDGVKITYIEDLTPLKKLTKLTTLSLSGNFISDLSPLVSLPNLTELSINNAALGDISPVAEMKNLTSVSFYYNGIEDVTPLSKLPKLEYIHLDYNYIKDLSPFRELDPNVVKYVSVDMNAFEDTTPLKHLGKDKVNFGYDPYWE